MTFASAIVDANEGEVVTEVTGCLDDFDRTAPASDWGTSHPLGITYTYYQGTVGSSTDGRDGLLDLGAMGSGFETARILDLNPVSLPFEALIRMRLAQTPFPPVFADLFNIYFALTDANPWWDNAYVLDGPFQLDAGIPNGGFGFNAIDERGPDTGGDGDNDDLLALTDGDVLSRDFYVRFYVDDHGVYTRCWYVGGVEPLASGLYPFGGGVPGVYGGKSYGKGESWSSYRVEDSGKNPTAFRYLWVGALGQSGTVSVRVRSICFLQGLGCSDGTCG